MNDEEGRLVDQSNINWILAIASFLAGVGLGILGYHLLSSSVTRNQKMRQHVAETELELSQIRDSLDEHFTTTTELVKNIRHQSHELEQRLLLGIERLTTDPEIKRRLIDGDDASATDEATPSIPRDYADGNHGTLAEDFGLRQSENAEAAPQLSPARH
jgi:uncharacterized membrane-anchored protein YhcB (DUF1043 family)